MKPNLILGTFQNNNYQDLLNVVDAAFLNKCYAFDTAPSYGTETDLGKALASCMEKYAVDRSEVFVSDKVDAWQMIEGKGDVEQYITNALNKMQLDFFDVVWIHWPIAEFVQQTWNSLQKIHNKGLVRAIGICNVRVKHLEELKKNGINPRKIQIERHPLRVGQDEMDYCLANNIEVYSYSPICRMHHDLRNSSILQRLAEKYHKNIGQIILRWHLDTYAIPIFMSKNPKRVAENLNIMDFRLDAKDLNEISSLNQNYKIFLESWGCPGF